MFCYQCQETLKNTGCDKVGVCGKTDEVAVLQDLLIYQNKGISYWAVAARELGVNSDSVNKFVLESIFTTVTNVNFDAHSIIKTLHKGEQIRKEIKDLFLFAYKKNKGADFAGDVPEAAEYVVSDKEDELIAKGATVGVLAEDNVDIRSLKELLVYGVKGIAAYADHALILNFKDDGVDTFVQEAMAATLKKDATIDELLGLVLKGGECSVNVLALLDKANTSTFGTPEITEVSTALKKGPGILISGHDLLDLRELLEQTEGTGINIYTHGEMLPANAYPALKKYKHLAGNYGDAWYNQKHDFEVFGGPILMTTNCIQKPRDSYKDRIFTTGLVGVDGVAHIADRVDGKPKDFSAIIAKAKEIGDLQETEGKVIPVGFGHDAVLSIADKIVDAVKSGAIKRFFVLGGCDGRQPQRAYHTDLAKKLPADTVILTAGCAKYRYNLLDLGDIGGIPRVIDAGQCNDSYSLAVIALKLVEVFQANSINDLPISFNIAWYEQKAVCVLLALLHLGVTNIRLMPTLPAFLSPTVANVLIDKFDLKLAANVDEDLEAMLAGK